MALKLNVTTSIVDALKAQGKPSDYNARLSLYKSSGLDTRLGQYVGSAAQNTALLKGLNASTSKPVEPLPIDFSTFSPESKAIYDKATGGKLPAGVVDTSPKPPPPEEPVGNSGITATQALSSIPSAPTTDDILSKVLGSPAFQNYQEGAEASRAYTVGSAEAEKQKLEATAAANTQAFIDRMGQRGLFFSGETQSGIQALAEGLASSKLGVDRELANQLIQSDVKTRDKIISMVESVVKEAKDGRKEAIASLENVGLTIVGDEVVPTLAAQREERQIQSEERLAQTAAFNQQATLARLELSEQAAARAAKSLQLSIDMAAGGKTVTSGGLTISSDAIGTAASELNAKRGADGWTDPYLYVEAYRQWTDQGGLPQDFANSFPPKLYVNPAASGLGILPEFLQNKPSNNVLIFNPAAIQSALTEGE